VVGNSERVKNFRGHALMSQRGQVDAVSGPQARIAELGEAPEVDELQAEVVGDAAQQLVVDRGSAAEPPKQRHGAEVACGEREYMGAGLLQGLEGVGIPGHHRVDVVAHQQQVVHARVDDYEVGFEHNGGLELFREKFVHSVATHGAASV